MNSIKEINASNIPLVIIDKRLNALDKTILFPKKVEEAKNFIEKFGLPKVKRIH